VLASLEYAVDLDIFESKLVSLCRPPLKLLTDLASVRLKHRLADFETDTEFCLFTIILIVRPGIAGVGMILFAWVASLLE
jgi:hypothetical protein